MLFFFRLTSFFTCQRNVNIRIRQHSFARTQVSALRPRGRVRVISTPLTSGCARAETLGFLWFGLLKARTVRLYGPTCGFTPNKRFRYMYHTVKRHQASLSNFKIICNLPRRSGRAAAVGRQAAAYLVRGDKGEIERRCSGDIGVDRLLLTWLGSRAGF